MVEENAIHSEQKKVLNEDAIAEHKRRIQNLEGLTNTLRAEHLEAIDNVRKLRESIQDKDQILLRLKDELKILMTARENPTAVVLWYPQCTRQGCKWMKSYKGSESKNEAITLAKSHKTKGTPHTVKILTRIRFREKEEKQ